MKYYCEILLDQSSGGIAGFEVEAQSAHEAMRLITAYTKGLFEGSGKGADVQSVSTKKARGLEYRRL